MKGNLVSVNLSHRKHEQKLPVTEAELRPDCGLVGDAHAGPGNKQVSLLALSSFEKMKKALEERVREAGGKRGVCPKAGPELVPGVFAENLTIEGLELFTLPLGTRLVVGGRVVLELTSVGKECHSHCAVYRAVGDCVMPREGVFARVLAGGTVRPGDPVEVAADSHSDDK